MTLTLQRDVAGAATHALVIGVPHYRHLPGGEGPLMRNGFGLTQLQAPRLSAREMVGFLEDEYRNAGAPLASIELLLPADDEPDQGDLGTAAESPTMANIKAAVQRWFQRCNAAPDNVAFFYYCGHGFEGAEQYLLAEDFGAFEDNFLDNTINLDRFHAGMAQCRARTQFFFVDACRELPRALEKSLPGGGQELLGARLGGNQDRDAPILRAAAKGKKAFARKGQSTQFVQALLQGFRGAGAVEDVRGSGRWSVRYQHLASAVGQLLANSLVPGARQDVRTSGEAGDALVHELDGPPSVPVVVLCDPEACAEIARLELSSVLGGESYRRDPAAGPWQLAALPDAYRLMAEVEAPFSAAPLKVLVLPPLRTCTVKVTS